MLTWIRFTQADEVHDFGEVVGVRDPDAREIIAQGKAIRHVFPAGDSDDVEGMRDKYRQANGGRPLWDERSEEEEEQRSSAKERKRSPRAPRSTSVVPEVIAAAKLSARIRQIISASQSAEEPQSVAPEAIRATLNTRIQQMLGTRSAKYQRRRQAEAGSVTAPAAKLKTAAKRLAAGRCVTVRR
jgi:hypothetical protein